MSLWVREPEPVPLWLAAWLLLTFSAVLEGIVLGGLQALGIRWFLPTVSIRLWIFATIAVGTIGWGIGTVIPLFLVG